ncbi:MAG: cytochrome C [Cyanobacteria bacterium P01_A01_bin.45]
MKRKSRKRQQKLRRKPVGLFIIILVWSLGMGFLLALATNVQGATPISTTTSNIGTVDAVPAKYNLGQKLYLENCSTCHLGIPPAVLPTQTWKNLIQDSEHYGATLKPLVDPERLLVWRYISTFSRPRKQDERTPYRLNNSRFLKALHPRVELPSPVKMGSCVTCHPGAEKYNFRTLTSEWDNSN